MVKINQIGNVFLYYAATGLGEDTVRRMCFTSDERETFLQSDTGKPLADFICVQLPERFGRLSVHVLGRRSYIPAAYRATWKTAFINTTLKTLV